MGDPNYDFWRKILPISIYQEDDHFSEDETNETDEFVTEDERNVFYDLFFEQKWT